MSERGKHGPNKKGQKGSRNQRADQPSSAPATLPPQQQPQSQKLRSGSGLQREAQQVQQPQVADKWQTFSQIKGKRDDQRPSQAGPSAKPSAWGPSGTHQKLSQAQNQSFQGQQPPRYPPRQQQQQQFRSGGQQGFYEKRGSGQDLGGGKNGRWQDSGRGHQVQQYQQKQSYPVASSQQDTVVLPFSQMNVGNEQKNVKQGGTLGKPIKVETNMMQILFGKNFRDFVYFYDVKIEPEKKKYLYRKAFTEVLKAFFPQKTPIVAFDGKKIAVSAKQLDFNNQGTIAVLVKDDDGNDTEYKVSLQLASKLDFTWLKKISFGLKMDDEKSIALQALNIIFNNAALKCSIPLKRAFYMSPKNPIDIGSGMDMHLGLFQSVIIGSKPYLNVDVVHKGFFRKQNLLDLIKVICFEDMRPQNRNALPPRPQDQVLTLEVIERNWNDIHDIIKGLRVTIVEDGKKIRSRQRIHSLTTKKPSEDFFHMEKENKNVSVQQYYLLAKNYRIKYPELPCVILNNKFKSHVPIETCEIEPGQSAEVEKTKRNIIKESAVNTYKRKDKIHDMLQPVNHNADNFMKEFGISIEDKFSVIPARILNPPTIFYQNQYSAQVQRGTWIVQPFKNPENDISKNSSWTVLIVDQRTHISKADEFARSFREEAMNYGMLVGEPNRASYNKMPYSNLIKIENYFKEQKKLGVKFVIVIFDGEKKTYATIKQTAELKVGILTQGIKSVTYNYKISKGDRSTMINILQKINTKLNGINHSFITGEAPPKFLEKCMIMGADVTHKPPGSKDPSIAAVVASHDPKTHFQYNAVIKLQEKETILNLESIMKVHLRCFHDKNKYYPEKIIFYRDGVGDSQIQEIVDAELTAIKKAWKSVTGNANNLIITFLIVQKRHHTRFFPTRREDSDDKNFNVKAGTVVDTEITSPNRSYQEFYLVSHASILGTSRPTKYKVIYTNDSLTADQLQSLTYYLCHNFARCARSVSIPAPTYYAHLAAFRAKAFIYGVDIDLTNLEAEQIRKLNLHDDMMKHPMFFC